MVKRRPQPTWMTTLLVVQGLWPLGSTTSIHIGHHGRFSGPWTSLSWSLVCGECGYCQPLPDQSLIKQGGPSFSQALGSVPVGADVILGCATRRAHLASADVADFLDGQDRLQDIWAHLLDVECACKCKTHLLGSSNATSHDISVADARSHFGSRPYRLKLLDEPKKLVGVEW